MKPREHATEVEIPILTAGDYGEAGRWTTEILDALAADYDPSRFAAPLVIGHPQHDAPAHGWVRSLRRAGNRLWARIGGLSAEVVRKVREGRFKKVSAALYPAQGSNAPRLKHVGLLGAMAPRDPSLPAVVFADTPLEGGAMAFNWVQPPSWLLRLASAIANWFERWGQAGGAQADGKDGAPAEAPEAEACAPAVEFAQPEPEMSPNALGRWLQERVAAGQLPPLFARRGGARFLKELAASPKAVCFAEGAEAVNPARWFMDTVSAFPATLFSESAAESGGGPATAQERLAQRAFNRLDAEQGLKKRGITMELFKKVYSPEDCRRILEEAPLL